MNTTGKTGLEVVVEQRGELSEVILVGCVDERASAQLDVLLSVTTPRVTFNFRGVTEVNSRGLGSLMKTLDDLCRDHVIEYAECPDFVVDCLQMLSICFRKVVRSVFFGHKIDSLALPGIEYASNRKPSRIAYWAGGQTFMQVCVVGRRLLQILSDEKCVKLFKPVNYSRISLQGHADR